MSNWNLMFTNIIRQSNNNYWGNWSLETYIQPGAIGTLKSEIASFNYIGNLENVRTKDDTENIIWKLSSHNVSRETSSLQLDASATDPETETKVETGLKVDWIFNEREGLVSEFSISRLSSIDDLINVIHNNKEQLFKQAQLAGMGDGKIVSQGFGIISSVLYAKSGLNLGSSIEGNTFSLSGTVKGINELVGANAGSEGSYYQISNKYTIDLHIWPQKPKIVPSTEVPIAFTFVSFDGDVPLFNWIQPIPSLILVFKNNSTYAVDYELEYYYDQQKIYQNGTLIGGLTQTIGNIKVSATAMKLKLKFNGILSCDHYEHNWQIPRNEWIGNTCNIELYGIWPGQTHYTVNFS